MANELRQFAGGYGLDEPAYQFTPRREPQLKPYTPSLMEQLGGKAYDIVEPFLGRLRAQEAMDRVKLLAESTGAVPVANVLYQDWMGGDVPASERLMAAAGVIPGVSPAMKAARKNIPAHHIGIPAYHVSPHEFEKFDISKMGSGEGAQVYGKGLYYMESPETRQWYYDQFVEPKYAGKLIRSKEELPTTEEEAEDYILAMLRGQLLDDIEDVDRNRLQHLRDAIEDYQEGGYQNLMNATIDMYRSGRGAALHSRDIADLLEEVAPRINPRLLEANKPSIYDVNLKVAPRELLDYDRLLTEQPEAVRSGVLNAFREMFPEGTFKGTGVGGVYIPESVEMMQKLHEKGVPGIKYLDAMSRGPKGKANFRNYVIFHDELVEILRRYGVPGTLAPVLYEMMMQGDEEQTGG